MEGANHRLVSAMRQIRAIVADDRGLPEALLEILRATTASVSAKLRRPMHERDESRVGCETDGLEVVRLESRFPARSGVAIIELTRPASQPFDDGDALVLELLGGEIVARIDRFRAELEASQLRREIDVLRALSRSGDGAPPPFDVADRAAIEVLAAFAGAHLLVHLVVDHHLELIARRTQEGNGLSDAPAWSRIVPLDGQTVMALAARKRTTVQRLTDDVEPSRRADLAHWGIRHVLSVPLVVQGVVLGTLTVAHRDDAPWDDDSLHLVEEVGAQLGVELAQARVIETERRRAEDLGLVNEVGSLVAQHLELRAVLSTAATALARVLAVPHVHVLVGDAEDAQLRGVGATDDGVADVEIPLAGSEALLQPFRTLAPVVIEDAETDSRTDKARVAQVGARSLAFVPLVAGGRTIGVIALVETRRKRRFSDSEVARVVAVSNVLAPAVTNARMFEDLRRSYEALAKAQADLVTHERLAALGELSAAIAHEVRNPVAIIFNSLNELRRVSRASEEATVLLGIIQEETSRLNHIVGDLLDFVRPYDAHPRLVVVEAIVQSAVDAARRAAPECSAEAFTSVNVPSRPIFLDGTMLQQALLNLVVNAIQATPAGKRVTVDVDVVSESGRENLRCAIADEGSGIDASIAARIFQPFFTTKATGTGLGLAVVRRLAEALGGTICATARPGGGALFTLTVPLSPPP